MAEPRQRRRRRFAFTLLGSLLLLFVALPVRAFSALAAWRINSEGVLELRTAPFVNLMASYEAGDGVRGPRVWVDLPGTPSRPRSIRGGGPIREIRIGSPQPNLTRLVIEFQPGVQLDPSRLRLVGVDRDNWKLQLPAELGSYLVLGEGSVDVPDPIRPAQPDPIRPALPDYQGPSGQPRAPLQPLRAADLPLVRRGRYRVVIDPGHGGPDPGAIGIGSIQEKDVVLGVSQQVADLLRSRGVDVLLTRNGDIDVDLPPRAQLANASGADAFVSIHANALSMARPDVNGLETFYFQSLRGKNLASSIHSSIMRTVRREDRGVREGRFYVIRATRMPSTLVELGFLTGADDAADIADPSHRRQLSLAVASGVLDYLRQAE
jgi:N-acetylmuramoyl-L-alanine amidase